MEFEGVADMRRFVQISLPVIVWCLFVSQAISQKVVFFEDFEKGPGTQVGKIKRYPMDPEIVSSDPVFPGAFPPPSGKFVARVQDKDHSYFGLGSIVAGPEIDLNQPDQKYAAVEAEIYLAPSTSVEMNQFALIALDDRDKIEKYYRFGYKKGSIYFSMFDGAGFMESLFDPDLGASLIVPGWHTFSIRFDGPDRFFLYVNEKKTFFSPIEQNDIQVFRMGVLGWDRQKYSPILADDFKVTLFSSPPQGAPASNQAAPQSNFFLTPTATFAPSSPAMIQQNIWYENTGQAVQEAQKTGRKFLAFFYIPNHAKSQQMEQKVLQDPSVQATLNKFVLVKLNGRVNTADADRYGIFKYPTLLVLDIQGRVYWEYLDIPYPQELNHSLARF
jgi:hypothetical protein